MNTDLITPCLLLWQHNKPIFVIPAEAGIQEKSGCRIKPGMTELVSLLAGVIIIQDCIQDHAGSFK